MTHPSYDAGKMRFFEDWTLDEIADSATRVVQIMKRPLFHAAVDLQIPVERRASWSSYWAEALTEFERGYNDAKNQEGL